MVVSKIFEGTLTAGSTSISFTDSNIPNSLIRVYSTDDNLAPVSYHISGNTITIVYPEQTTNKDIALEIVKEGVEIIDSLSDTSTDKALSAKQGKNLKDAIDAIIIPTVPENITDLEDVNVTSISNGQVLAWDSVSEKFVNVTPSSGGTSIDYSTTEQVIGKWIDGRDLYQKTVNFGALPNNAYKSTAHDISNLDYIVSFEGTAKSTTYLLPIPYLHLTTASYYIEVYFTDTNIVIGTKSDRSGYDKCYITLRYVKTAI